MKILDGIPVVSGWFVGLERRTQTALALFVLFAILSAGLIFIYGGETRDLRSSLPSNALAFLSVKDLGKVYRRSSKLKEIEKQVDLSFLDGLEIAVAVTGLETKERQQAGTGSILDLRPRFAAVAETNLWSWQIDGLIDGPLTRFFESEYGVGTKKSVKAGKHGDLVVWSGPDGRTSFLATEGTIIFLGNSEEAVEECLAAHNGEVKSILDDAALSVIYKENPEAIAVGYFPRRAIEAFAEAAGVSAAVRGSDDRASRLFISSLVPQLFENTVESAVWLSHLSGEQFEDEILLRTNGPVSRVFSETMREKPHPFGELVRFLPRQTSSLTRYNLQDPQIGFRSLVLVAARNTDPLSSRLVSAYSNAILESYGIANPEQFLTSVGPLIVTFEVGDGDSSAALVTVKNRDEALGSLLSAFQTGSKPRIVREAELWDADGMTVAMLESSMIIGETTAVEASLAQQGSNGRIAKSELFNSFLESSAAAVSLTIESSRPENSFPSNEYSFFLTETSFEVNGIVRRYRSRFGFFEAFLPGASE